MRPEADAGDVSGPVHLPQPAASDADVRAAQLEQLVAHGVMASLGATAAAAVAAVALMSVVDRITLFAWLGAVALVQLVRLVAVAAYRRVTKRKDQVARWTRIHVLLVVVSAVAFGVGPIVIWPAEPLHQLIIPITIGGLSAFAASAYAAVRGAALAYPIITLTPVAARLFATGTQTHVLLGCLVLAYLAVQVRMSLVMHAAALQTLRVGFVNRALVEELSQLVRRDALTGIANRRQFEEALTREWQRARRNGEPLAVLVLDIDHFKDFNDDHGHAAGDDCLRKVATALQGTLRLGTDVVCRYGGEEFAAILAGATAEQATVTAERLRAAVRALAIPHARSPVAPIITISAGVASQVPSASDRAEELVKSADVALYAAKRGGRDRVETAGW